MTETTPRVALVTGASRGIGQAIAIHLGRLGHTVIGTATSEQGASHINEVWAKHNIQGTGLVLDVMNIESITALFEHLKNSHTEPLILVNNAAITKDNILLRMRPPEWDQVINTNLNAVYHLSKFCLRAMTKARWGRIISIGSVVGSMGNMGQSNYAAAKAGVIGFSRSLAREIASRGVTVNTVDPGFIDTDMTKGLAQEHRESLKQQIPMGRLGEVDDVAHAVAFLASEQASYITGVSLPVNGGMYMG